MLAENSSRTQRSLAPALQVQPSRLVATLDELQRKRLIERRVNEEDRRAHALHLTRGSQVLARVRQISMQHEQELTSPLSSSERQTLEQLLDRMAQGAGLARGGHLGFDATD